MWSSERRQAQAGSLPPWRKGSWVGVSKARMRSTSTPMPDKRTALRLGLAFSLALLTAGCFQPLYGDPAVVPTAGLNDKLSTVDIPPLDVPNGSRNARIGVHLRNALIFDFNGGANASVPAYRLDIKLSSNLQQVIVDMNTGRPDIQNYAITANYTLSEIATKKPIFIANAIARVSYNIPGQQQRFTGDRGLIDAEDRAAKVLADEIRSRVSSYFVSGS
jgi:LPS-assembly lipoprotein